MFGLESQKKKKPSEEFVFELEKELKDPAKHKEIRQRVDMRLQKIKEMLRTGDDQEEFDRLGLLLHGYNSLLKVMSRFTPKLNRKSRRNMDEEKMEEFKEDFALLIEAGFVAVKQLDEISATRIFHAAQALSPSNTAPIIGIGYIALNKLEIKEATRAFETVTKLEPENYLAQTFLGMCFLLTKGRGKKGEKIIKEAMEKTTDPTIRSLGSLSLEWAERDLSKKSKAPFFAQQPEPPAEENEKITE